MSAPLVSVVIASYNHARFIGTTIESILSQTYSPLEVVVVDDGSPDDSVTVIRSFGDRIRCIQQKNAGPSAARNTGIKASHGEFIALLDSDDVWAPEKLKLQIERFANPKVGFVTCGIEYIDADGKSMGISLEGAEGDILEAHATLREKTVGPPSAVVARRSCFESVGYFDPKLSMSADWDMWRRIGSSYELAFVREPLLKYRVHASGMHHNVDLLERDMLYAFERMFEDPRSASVKDRRRECYANLYVTLCGAFLHRRQWRKSMRYAVRSLQERPDRLLLHTLAMPARKVRRRLFGADPA